MIAGIVELLKALFSAVPYFDKWLNPPAIAKEEDIQKAVADEKNDFKKTGRPKW